MPFAVLFNLIGIFLRVVIDIFLNVTSKLYKTAIEKR